MGYQNNHHKNPYPPSHFPCIPVQDTYEQTWDKVPWLTQAKKKSKN